MELEKTYQRYTGLLGNFDRVLHADDGLVVTVAKLPFISELHDQGGRYLVSAAMASYTSRQQFGQQC